MISIRRRAIAAAVALLCCSTGLPAQTINWRVATDLDGQAYDAAMIAQAADGFRPVTASACDSAAGVRYCVVFYDDDPAWQQQRGLTLANAQNWINSQAAAGYRPIALLGTGPVNTETYAVVLAQESGPAFAVRLNQTQTQLNTEINGGLGALGYRVNAISAWGSGASRRFATIWHQNGGAGWFISWNQSPVALANNNALFDTQGLRMTSCSADGLTLNPTQQATWAPLSNSDGHWQTFLGQNQSQFQATVAQMELQTFRPTVLNAYVATAGIMYNSIWIAPPTARIWRAAGREVPSLNVLDDAMQELMQRSHIPAGQLAVTYQGRMVFNRAYTWADTDYPLTNVGNRFRIASVTKTTATATAILQLIEQGQLSLNTTMISVLGGTWTDARVAQITLRNLLQHTGGWDRYIAGDPIFQDRAIAAALGVPLPITQAHIVQYMRTRSLNFTPGARWAYSNFGYLLLGQIVEAITGQQFDDYVRENVWDVLGADDGPRPGGAFLPMPNEPTYVDLNDGHPQSVYDNNFVPTSYGSFNMENCEALGNFTVSARDLARFTGSFTFPDESPILSAASINAAWNDRVSLGNGYGYGLGWIYTPNGAAAATGFWHDGALPGTQAWIKVRHTNDITWSVVLNANPYYSTDLQQYGAVDEVIDPAIDSVSVWPAGDLWCRADISWDGLVNLQDLAILLAHFGTATEAGPEDGDLDDDGDVDLGDLAQVLAKFGTTCP